jgi:hypothetical protein
MAFNENDAGSVQKTNLQYIHGIQVVGTTIFNDKSQKSDCNMSILTKLLNGMSLF